MINNINISSRTVVGKVVSVRMNKTIIVQTERKVKHALYGKYIRKYSRMYAHDDQEVCGEGDVVLIRMCRPVSKTKHWALVSVVTPAAAQDVAIAE